MPASPVSPSPSRLPSPCPSYGQQDCSQDTTLATATLPPCPITLSLLSSLAKPTVDEAKKYYPLFGLGANVALIFFGQSVSFVASLCANLPPVIDPWGISLKYLIGAVCASGGCLVVLFTHMTDPACIGQEMRTKQRKKKKTSMGLRESVKFLLALAYIRNLVAALTSRPPAPQPALEPRPPP